MAANLKPRSQQAGLIAERQACDYLTRHGLLLRAKNYRFQAGEIDLIMQDKNELVFVEVRLRNNAAHADGLESVDENKQRKLILTATHYLQQHRLLDKVNCRFDVVGIAYPRNILTVEWITDAFTTDTFF